MKIVTHYAMTPQGRRRHCTTAIYDEESPVVMMSTPEAGRIEILPAEISGVILRAIDRNGRVVAQQTIPRDQPNGNILRSEEREGRVTLDSSEEPFI